MSSSTAQPGPAIGAATLRPVAPAARAMPRLAGFLILLGLVLLAVLRSQLGTRLDSFTVDEPWHIVAGSYYLRSGDFRLNPEHPPLVKLWTGAAMGERVSLRTLPVLSEKAQERDLVEEMVFYANDPAQLQARSRLAMWSLHAALLMALGLLLWKSLGLAWAATSLAFLAIDPTVAAHLPVVMTDLPLALTLAIAAVCAGLLLASWQWRWALALGVALGLALGAKHSALAGIAGIAGVAVLAAALGWRRGGWRQVLLRMARLVLAGLLGIAVLWAQYGFQFHAARDGTDPFNRPMPAKVADLNLGHWRQGIALADRWQLLPRSYLWGLADTVRTGVEGRGITQHLLWGKVHDGRAPWFSWPSIIVSKLPLALLLLALLGAASLFGRRLAPRARWVLACVAAAAAFHLLALVGSDGVWGGIRHAMPVVVALAIPAGALAGAGWARWPRAGGVLVPVLLGLALAMTLREPRAWEYHNELAGGTEGASRRFGNEGLDLGQRFEEIRAFHDEVIAPGGLPLYSSYWVPEEQLRGAGIGYRRRVESLDDTNVEGLYEGYFIYTRSSHVPMPSWDWDPAEVFAGLEKVAGFGYVEIWKGRQVLPRTRASSLSGRVVDYLYKEGGQDWALVARRLEEVVALSPQSVVAGVELGNAYLRLGNGAAAAGAYRRLLEQTRVPLDPDLRRQLQAQVASIEGGSDLASVTPLRNPFLE